MDSSLTNLLEDIEHIQIFILFLRRENIYEMSLLPLALSSSFLPFYSLSPLGSWLTVAIVVPTGAQLGYRAQSVGMVVCRETQALAEHYTGRLSTIEGGWHNTGKGACERDDVVRPWPGSVGYGRASQGRVQGRNVLRLHGLESGRGDDADLYRWDCGRWCTAAR